MVTRVLFMRGKTRRDKTRESKDKDAKREQRSSVKKKKRTFEEG